MYKATISFSGVVSMSAGELKEIKNPDIAKELLRCGYIVKAETEEEPKETTEETSEAEEPIEKSEEVTEEEPKVEEEKPEKKAKSKKTK